MWNSPGQFLGCNLGHTHSDQSRGHCSWHIPLAGSPCLAHTSRSTTLNIQKEKRLVTGSHKPIHVHFLWTARCSPCCSGPQPWCHPCLLPFLSTLQPFHWETVCSVVTVHPQSSHFSSSSQLPAPAWPTAVAFSAGILLTMWTSSTPAQVCCTTNHGPYKLKIRPFSPVTS